MANDDQPPDRGAARKPHTRFGETAKPPGLRQLTTVPGPEHAHADCEDDQAARYSLGPCRDCGAYGPRVIVIPAVRLGKRRETVIVCRAHSTKYVSRCEDLDWLARRRAAGTSETVEQALAALTGGRRRLGST